VWLSVDPMSDKYPSTSGYMYVLGRPTALIDPNGMNSWVPPTDGSGNWKAEKGDSPGSLARDAKITQAEAEGIMRDYNKANGNNRSSETMVYKDDVVNVASRPGYTYTWSSGASTTNSSTTASPNTPSTASNNSGNTNSTTQTANTVATMGGLVVDAGKQIAKIPIVGYNIAYNNTLLKSVNYLKPISYGLSGITVASDFYLSANNQQSWTETVINTAVTGVALVVGGWPGLVIQADYQAAKAYIKVINKHPDWVPFPIYAR